MTMSEEEWGQLCARWDLLDAAMRADDEEPYDLTEGATAATGAWLTLTAIVLCVLGVVLILLARGR